MMVKNGKIANIKLDGGTLCLDYINTVHNRKEEPLPDYLLNITDLIDWAMKVELLDAKKTKPLETLATSNPQKAEQFFKEAISIRELLYRIFYAISEGKNISAADLELYNKHLSQYFPFLQLKQQHGIYKEDWNLPIESFYRITAPLINDAYELLLSEKLERIKECPNCGWLFLDTTKNGKRRWCSMKSCGSNIKALEWYHRQKNKAI